VIAISFCFVLKSKDNDSRHNPQWVVFSSAEWAYSKPGRRGGDPAPRRGGAGLGCARTDATGRTDAIGQGTIVLVGLPKVYSRLKPGQKWQHLVP
jgi:hypothetical protein